MIDSIKQALEEITQGEWKANDMDTAYSNEVFVNPAEHVYREIAGGMTMDDAHFVANAPGWIRYLIGEVERYQGMCKRKNDEMEKGIMASNRCIEYMQELLQDTIDSRDYFQRELIKELERSKSK